MKKNRMSESLCRELNKAIIAHEEDMEILKTSKWFHGGRYAVNKEQVFQIPALFII